MRRKHSMRFWCPALVAVSQILFVSFLSADENSLFVDLNFDDKVPGMDCDTVTRNWGSQGQDLVLIDNLDTVNGDGNAMLFERSAGSHNTGWGVGINLPSQAYDWLKIQVSFFFDGPATTAMAGLELREFHEKLLYNVGLGAPSGGDPIAIIKSVPQWTSSKLNHFDRKAWNRVTWYVPSVTANKMSMYLTLEVWDYKTGTWHPVGETGSMEASKVTQPFALFRINFPAGEEPMKLRFDDLKIGPITNAQISMALKL